MWIDEFPTALITAEALPAVLLVRCAPQSSSAAIVFRCPFRIRCCVAWLALARLTAQGQCREYAVRRALWLVTRLHQGLTWAAAGIAARLDARLCS